jgi:hypothetical protein
MGDMRNAYTVSVGKSEGKRPRDRWENKSIIDLNETVMLIYMTGKVSVTGSCDTHMILQVL